MTHRALVQRATETVDGYNNRLAPVWATHLAAQPCYFWQPSMGRGEQSGAQNYRAYGYQVVMPLGTDVTERDRINGIVDRRGYSVHPGVFGIVAVVRKPDHLLLTLETIT